MNPGHDRTCPVCCEAEMTCEREMFDDRYGHPGRFHLVRCKHCDHLMTQPALKEEELAGLYGSYYPRENICADDVLAQAERVDSAFSGIRRWWLGTDNQGQYCVRPGEKMLDIGCGSGVSLLEARKLGAEAWGVEADPNVERLARQLELPIHLGNLQDRPFEGVEFDLIVLNQVIEHIPEPDKALQTIQQRLAPGGRVILIFPNVSSLWCKLSGSRWINWHIPYHQHHFTLAGFTRMAQRCGFRLLRSRTITPNGWTLLQILANRQSIARGEVNPMWRVKPPSQTANAAVQTSPVPLKKLVRLPVRALVGIVNRLVDGLGYGDSLLVELSLESNDR